MWCVVGHVQQERLIPGRSFGDEIGRKVGDQIGLVCAVGWQGEGVGTNTRAAPRNHRLPVMIDEKLAGVEPGPELFAGQFAAYADSVDTGAPIPVTVADARAAIELVTAIYHSSRTGKAVDLPLGADHPLYDGWIPESGS